MSLLTSSKVSSDKPPRVEKYFIFDDGYWLESVGMSASI